MSVEEMSVHHDNSDIMEKIITVHIEIKSYAFSEFQIKNLYEILLIS